MFGVLVLGVEERRPGALSITLGADEESGSLVIVLLFSLIVSVTSLSEILVLEKSCARESVAALLVPVVDGLVPVVDGLVPVLGIAWSAIKYGVSVTCVRIHADRTAFGEFPICKITK